MSEPEDAPYRYNGQFANKIELAWQDRWEAEHTFDTPNPIGDLATGFDASRPKLYVLDMFPYPSGTGLHMGHPMGYTGTDAYVRFKRMDGFNVLYSMGYDSFGLPAEQYAVQTGTHPRVTTDNNVNNMRTQFRRLGYAHDSRRGPCTTDIEFYKWTQWMFLQIFNSWYDRDAKRARPIAELIAELESGQRTTDQGPYSALSKVQQRDVVDGYRLAYRAEVPVNWCPALGTVLANEEVTADGKSDRGNFPVYKRKLAQWMMRITEYTDRLLDDLDLLDWTESIKTMQRNWIGRSVGAQVDFGIEGAEDLGVSVYTTRPDTLFGCTYMALAPEIELVDQLLKIAPTQWPDGTNPLWTGGHDSPHDAIAAYRAATERETEAERTNDERPKTGVFTATYAINPINGERVPIFVADYVLAGYGTGAVMAVPSNDARDNQFARKYELPIIEVIEPPSEWDQVGTYVGYDGVAINSTNPTLTLDGVNSRVAKQMVIDWLTANGSGRASVNTKLRDWLFSRQRYWGEPFPIVYDEDDQPIALPESMLPVELPEVDDYAPTVVDDDAAPPAPPLARATHWSTVELDLGDGPKTYRRELNTMPQWAGSCWYEMRYMDPTNSTRFVDREVEAYWSNGNETVVDLYVGGVEHAVLHLLYARFWHKVLFDLGHVQTREPFGKLFNQGMLLAAAYTDERGLYVQADQVEERDGQYFFDGKPVSREYGKMGKSLKNSIDPTEFCQEYGADTLRLYLMSIGPLEKSKPWESRQTSGVYRFLQRAWRNAFDENTGATTVVDAKPDGETLSLMHKTITGVRYDYESLGFNTAIAKMIEFNNHLTGLDAVPREAIETLVLLLAPLAPHFSEEAWSRLGHDQSLHIYPFPVADPQYVRSSMVEIPVQINGKVRARVELPVDADEATIRAAALAHPRIIELLDGVEPRKVVIVPGKLLSIVL